MKITLISEHEDETVEMEADVIQLDKAVEFIDRFLKASGFIYQGDLVICEPLISGTKVKLEDYVTEEDTDKEQLAFSHT